MTDDILMFLVMTLLLIIGSCTGDQTTLQDCASKGRAEMLGGGSIKCEVEKGQAA